MRKLSILLVIAASIIAPSQGRAAGDVLPSAIVEFGPHAFTEEAVFGAECTFDDIEYVFTGDIITFDSGWSRGLSKGGTGYGGVRASATSEEVELFEEVETPGFSGSDGFTIGMGPGETLHLMIASWGGSMSCSFTIDDDPVAATLHPVTNGARLTDIGFDSTAASANAYGFNAVAGGTYEREIDGFMWLFWTSEAGVVSVIGPDGVYGVGAGVIFDTWITGAEETSGTWTFTAAGAVLTDLALVIT